jgi:hypothetical protein
MPTWTLQKGDYGVVKQATIMTLPPNSVVKDLSGLTATLIVWAGDPSNPVLTVGINIVSPPTQGIVQWVVGQSDMETLEPLLTGYSAQIQFTAAGYQSTTKKFGIIVLQAAT